MFPGNKLPIRVQNLLWEADFWGQSYDHGDYNATGSLAHFEKKPFWNLNAGVEVVNYEAVGLAPGLWFFNWDMLASHPELYLKKN
jgi:hypothetical protein